MASATKKPKLEKINEATFTVENSVYDSWRATLDPMTGGQLPIVLDGERKVLVQLPFGDNMAFPPDQLAIRATFQLFNGDGTRIDVCCFPF